MSLDLLVLNQPLGDQSMSDLCFSNGMIVLEDRLVSNGHVMVSRGRIESVHETGPLPISRDVRQVDLKGGYLVPGYVDLHCHGGGGGDFMDGTADAFQIACRAHARHGTTSIAPTTTTGLHRQHLKFLELCRQMKHEGTGGSRVIGGHWYGPYFNMDARGAHSATGVRAPRRAEFNEYLEFADSLVSATVAPELPGAESFVRACRERSLLCTAGHTLATFEQMEQAVSWGVRHIDHLYSAMSDITKLRAQQNYPMRGGVQEATLYFDELSTEVIADGKHLQRELLLLAYKCKGPDRLILVTDCNRALDMPDGEYLIGPLEGGEPFIRRDNVGASLDGTKLASSVVGMDHMVRTFHRMTGIALPQVVRMASLLPARLVNWDQEIGSICSGKLADLVVLDQNLHVQQVYLSGQLLER